MDSLFIELPRNELYNDVYMSTEFKGSGPSLSPTFHACSLNGID